MRKKFSIICAIMIILVGMIGLSACGGSEDGGNTEKVRQTESVGFVKYAKPEGLEEIESSDGYCYYMGGDLSLEISTAVSNYSSLDEFFYDMRNPELFMTTAHDLSVEVDNVISAKKYDRQDNGALDIEIISYVEGNEATFKFTFIAEGGELVACDKYVNDFLSNVSFDWKMLGVDKPENINRYEEGFTLEEAKANTAEYGGIFIKKGEKYYPTLLADYSKKGGSSDSHLKYNINYVFFVDESNGERPVIKLNEGDKLVNVSGEETYDKVHILNGTSGYTVPLHPILDYGDEWAEKPMWYASGYDYYYSMYPSSVCRVNLISFEELTEVNGVDLEAVSQYNREDRIVSDEIQNGEIEGLSIQSADTYQCVNNYVINVSEKGEEVTCGYFAGTDYKEVKLNANIKYYNFPTDMKSEAVWKDITQSKSKEGYIEYDTSKLSNGLYALDYYIFEVAK